MSSRHETRPRVGARNPVPMRWAPKGRGEPVAQPATRGVHVTPVAGFVLGRDPTRRRSSGGAEAYGEGRLPGGQAAPPPRIRARARGGRAAVAQGGRVGGGHVQRRGCCPVGGGADRGGGPKEERREARTRPPPRKMRGQGREGRPGRALLGTVEAAGGRCGRGCYPVAVGRVDGGG